MKDRFHSIYAKPSFKATEITLVDGFKVSVSRDNTEKHSMVKYKVYFYFGLHSPNPFLKPSKIAEVEMVSWATEEDIIKKGLELIGTYPRTYSATVVSVD